MSNETGRFRRSDRLLDARDFRRVLRRGRRRGHRDLVIIMTNDQKITRESSTLPGSHRSGSRLGITASRKVGGAVIRNRFKRRVRAWFRERRLEFPEEIDLIVIARSSGARLSFDRLDQRLSGLMGLRAPEARQNEISQGEYA